MRFLKYVGCLSLLMSTCMSAPITTGTKFEAKNPSKTNPWTFEIKNKTKEPIHIQLYYKGQLKGLLNNQERTVAASRGSKESEHGYLRVMGLDPRKTIQIAIWSYLEDQVDTEMIEEGNFNVQYSIKGLMSAQKYVIAQNNKRKSIFVTYDHEELQAQKGKWGKTQSGLPLENNVTNKEIMRVDELKEQITHISELGK